VLAGAAGDVADQIVGKIDVLDGANPVMSPPRGSASLRDDTREREQDLRFAIPARAGCMTVDVRVDRAGPPPAPNVPQGALGWVRNDRDRVNPDSLHDTYHRVPCLVVGRRHFLLGGLRHGCGYIPSTLCEAGDLDGVSAFMDPSSHDPVGRASSVSPCRRQERLAGRTGQADARGGCPGESLGLSDDELASSDALETKDSAVAVLGGPVLREIARERVIRAGSGDEDAVDPLFGIRLVRSRSTPR